MHGKLFLPLFFLKAVLPLFFYLNLAFAECYSFSSVRHFILLGVLEAVMKLYMFLHVTFCPDVFVLFVDPNNIC